MQEVVKTVAQREDVLLYPEEAKIEDASKIEIDWLVDVKELNEFGKDDRLVALDDTLVLSQTDQSFFSNNPASQLREDKLQDTTQPLVL